MSGLHGSPRWHQITNNELSLLTVKIVKMFIEEKLVPSQVVRLNAHLKKNPDEHVSARYI